MKILIADDDTAFLDTLGYVLRREGYDVISASTGSHALKRWQIDAPDFVILDGTLPGVDGFHVCRQMRQTSSTPIIIMSTLQAEEDRVRGLKLGADDYMTKPIGLSELCARIKTIMRRSRAISDQDLAGHLRIGDLVLDLQSYQVTRDHALVRTTRLEFRILLQLALNAGHVVPHSQLVEYAWGYQDEGNSNLLKTHISHLRRKLHEHCNGDVVIESRINVGYRLVTNSLETISQPQINLDTTQDQPMSVRAVHRMD